MALVVTDSEDPRHNVTRPTNEHDDVECFVRNIMLVSECVDDGDGRLFFSKEKKDPDRYT